MGKFCRSTSGTDPKEKKSKIDELSKLDPFDSRNTTRVLIEYMYLPSIMAKSKVFVIDPPDWRSPIVSYLKEPQHQLTLSAKLKVKASKYTLIDNVLYKKSFTLPYLHCLGPDEEDYALSEIHEVICR